MLSLVVNEPMEPTHLSFENGISILYLYNEIKKLIENGVDQFDFRFSRPSNIGLILNEK